MIDALTVNPLSYIVTQIATEAELEPPALQLRRPTYGPREYLDALVEAELLNDALKFLAYLLPRREGVWWGWMCARKTLGEEPLPDDLQALQAAERWISEPTDGHRRDALEAANAATLESPAGCVALAAFLSGGSLAPAGMDEVPPPRYASAKAVYGALVFAAVRDQPEKAPERAREFLGYGFELAERIELWQSIERAVGG